MSQTQKCIVQFVWAGHDEGDYLCYRKMTREQVKEVDVLLTMAENEGRIRSGWYVGPLGESDDSHELFMTELKSSLNLEEDDTSDSQTQDDKETP